jgi:hypothetical protein
MRFILFNEARKLGNVGGLMLEFIQAVNGYPSDQTVLHKKALSALLKRPGAQDWITFSDLLR